ncbi:(2Fe-2S)-binding protein [Cardiobacterium sp. AH-315-I02]|nr:(2Fe-2S)-binding protein [Cardiobacterium sp. AH-315-I02]
MFKRLDKNPEKQVLIFIDDIPFSVPSGETVAAAVLASGIKQTRTTPISNTPRAPFCLMGVCYECLMIINGQANQRTCKEYVNEGMRIETQHGAGTLPEHSSRTQK